jgi:hypothetical protein
VPNEYKTGWLFALIHCNDIVISYHNNVFDGGRDFLLFGLFLLSCRCFLGWGFDRSLGIGCGSHSLLLSLLVLFFGNDTKCSVFFIVENGFIVSFHILRATALICILRLFVRILHFLFGFFSHCSVCIELVELQNHFIWQTFSRIVRKDEHRLFRGGNPKLSSWVPRITWDIVHNEEA